MSFWKMSDYCKQELSKVNPVKFVDELYILRHSPAARDTFARAQWYLALSDEDNESFNAAIELFTAVSLIAREVAHRHPIAYHKWNPKRKWVPSAYKFLDFAKELGVETKLDDWQDETLIRTIEGWRQV